MRSRPGSPACGQISDRYTGLPSVSCPVTPSRCPRPIEPASGVCHTVAGWPGSSSSRRGCPALECGCRTAPTPRPGPTRSPAAEISSCSGPELPMHVVQPLADQVKPSFSRYGTNPTARSSHDHFGPGRQRGLHPTACGSGRRSTAFLAQQRGADHHRRVGFVGAGRGRGDGDRAVVQFERVAVDRDRCRVAGRPPEPLPPEYAGESLAGKDSWDARRPYPPGRSCPTREGAFRVGTARCGPAALRARDGRDHAARSVPGSPSMRLDGGSCQSPCSLA